MAANTASVTAGGAARPAAIATPMNGAVQGVATSTASRPVKKLPRWLCRPAIRPLAPFSPRPRPTWNTPERFSPTANSSQAMAATKTGDWNWKPQPAAIPASRATSSTTASARKVASTPAV